MRISRKREVHRTLWVDACRGIAILLVLLGHNDPPFVKAIYGFHMPLFYMMSGYLYKDRHTDMTFVEEIKSLIKSLIIPYIIFGLINLGVHILHIRIVAPDTVIDSAMVLRYIKGIFTVSIEDMPCCYPMWFLPSLAITIFIFYLIRRFPNKYFRFLAFAVILLMTYLYCNNPDKLLPVNIHAAIPAVLFMEIGYILEHHRLIETYIIDRLKEKKKFLYIIETLAVIAVCAAIGAVGIHYNPIEPRVDMSCARLGNIPLFFLGAVFTSLAIIFLLVLLGALEPWLLKPFSYIGKHTVFFVSFDESTNSVGGTIISKIAGPISPTWYQAFAVRIPLMAVYFSIWLLITKLLPKLRKVTHS